MEGNTLKTRQKGMNMLENETSMPPSGDPGGRHRDRGSRGRKVVVIASRSRIRTVTDKDQKTSRGSRIAKRYPGANASGSNRLSGPGQEASARPVILGVQADHGESELYDKCG